MSLVRPLLLRHQAWRVVLAAGLLGVLVYFWLPTMWQEVGYDSWTTACAALILLGAAMHRPERRLPWLLLAGGMGLIALGDWSWTVLAVMGEEPFPSIADVFYLSGMTLVGASVWVLGRGHLAGGDRAAGIDALIIACGFALLTWFLVMKPIAAEGAASPIEAVVAMAYPSIDIALLAVTARLVFGSGVGALAYRVLALGLLAYLVADVSFAWLDSNGEYVTGHPVDAGWLIGALLFGLAALTPAADGVPSPIPQGLGRLTLRRVAILAAASLMAPLLLLVQAWQGTAIDALVIAAASIALFLLVIGRLVTVLVDLRQAFQQREALEVELRRQATQDPLTGLANRALFGERLEAAVGRAGERVGVIFLDLDDFKEVNDTLGHPAGDAVLREVSARILPLVRESDTVARLGGDEFAILLAGDPEPATATRVAERLLTALVAPYSLAGTRIAIGASAGLTVGTCGTASPESLMREADIAMYRAKAAGKGHFAVFDPTMAAEPLVEARPRPARDDRRYGAASAAAPT